MESVEVGSLSPVSLYLNNRQQGSGNSVAKWHSLTFFSFTWNFQGSIILGRLFVLQVKDLQGHSSPTKLVVNADDTSLIPKQNNPKKLDNISVNDKNKLHDWFNANELLLN